MRTLIEKNKSNQGSLSLEISDIAQPKLGCSDEESLPCYLHRKSGNQEGQSFLELNSAAALRRSGQDFAGIPLRHPKEGLLQTKLAMNKPGDEYEQEADRVAEQVMRMPEPQLQPACPCGGGCPRCQPEQPGQEHERPQTMRVGSGDSGQAEVPAIALEVLSSCGEPLGRSIRSYYEPRFGHDLSHVRVHHDRRAEQAARSVNAKAFTVGNHIVFGGAQFSPGSREGQQLLAHELTHVIQQSDVGGIPSNGGRGHAGFLQRTPEEADSLISRYASWRNLNETALGRELLRLALGGRLTLLEEVLNTLGSTDRDDVAYEFMLAATDQQLVRLSSATQSRQFLHRVFDELTSGSVSAEEQQQADRILQVTARQTVSVGEFESAATSRRTKIFPFRLPGFTVLNDAPIEARRERGGVWVHSFVRVLGTAEFRAETATLPSEYFLSGIVVPETEVIGVRLFDQGGIIHYTTPLFLIQLANATNQQILEKILEAAGIGLTLGTGSLAGLGVEASMAARVLLWADRAAFALGTVTSVLREHRSWLVAQFGAGFMDAVDTVYSATAIYGLARVALQAPRLIQGLRDSYRSFCAAARSRSSGFSSAQQTMLQRVTQSTDHLIEQLDNIEASRPAARPGSAEPVTPHPPAAPRRSEAAPDGPGRTREAMPGRGAPGPAAPRAAGAGGGYRPTQAELESYADRAWRILGGRGPRPAVTQMPLPNGTEGQYLSSPSTIEIGTGASNPGSVINTVWHEASHARIRQLVGFMNEHLDASWQRTLLRPLDEIVSYFIGGLGQVIQGPTVSSRLFGILQMLNAPIAALGSMATTAERALWGAHMLAWAAALLWAEFKILSATRGGNGSGPSQSAPAP